ncbi:Neurobeachin-like protein 1 [Irineochytrium annulatum]|nr:Neurobeachin-like protein 1 [Irineochytrium annulatum]
MPHLVPLLDKHAQSFADTHSRQRVLQIIAAVHDAFSLSSDLDNRILLPLYMLVVTRWQDYLAALKNNDGSFIISTQTLSVSETGEDRFVEMVSSSSWADIYNGHLFPALKQVEQEDFSVVPLVTKRFAKVARTTFVRWRRDEISVAKIAALLSTKVQTLAFSLRNDEISRMSEKVFSIESDRRYITRQWLSMYRELTQQRGIWGMDNRGDHWKLDRMENYLRMRPRLAKNYEFDDHRDASKRRDKVSYVGHEDKMGLQSSPRIERAMMKQSAAAALSTAAADRRKAQVEKLRMHFKSGSTAELLRDASEASLTMEEDDEEDWNVLKDNEGSRSVGSSSNATAPSDDTERFLCGADCEMILLMTAVKGRLELTTQHLSFKADLRGTAADLNEADQRILALLAESEVLLRERKWNLSRVREVYLRRYMLRNSALEVFFTDRTNYLFNFHQSKDKLKFLTKIAQLRPKNLLNTDARSPRDIIKRDNIVERWQRREISNFEYLMHLNTVSGRTYNDLTQYPVFPWVLVNFTSETIDLSDPLNYRDLSKPIGALNEARLEQYLERYRQFEDPMVPRFLYGTHYSTSAAVLFYLLRLEPFASLHIALQAGKFDHPDRQFHSMAGCWDSVFTGNSDVKELIPEFFYMPEFLLNTNKFDLGTKQTGAVVDDVILPKWASSAQEFIQVHRDALEGEYVSEHLHEWIDLIWGFKQTGENAAKANNLFYHLTYEGAINIDSVKDPVEKKSLEDQINNFGQTPSQLFMKPHPQRLPRSQCATLSLFLTPAKHRSYLVELRGSAIHFVGSCNGVHKAGLPPAGSGSLQSFLSGTLGNEKHSIVTVDSSLTVGLHRCSAIYILRVRVKPILPTITLCVLIRRPVFILCQLRELDIIYGHYDIVTCVSLSEDGKTLLTGSRDTTTMAWDLIPGAADTITVRQNAFRIFYGHDDEVTSVAANVEHDLVASASKDGTCILHAFHDAKYVRSIFPSSRSRHGDLSIQLVKMTKAASILLYSEETSAPTAPAASTDGKEKATPKRSPSFSAGSGATVAASGMSFLHVYSINGSLCCEKTMPWRLQDIEISKSGEYFACADNRNGIMLVKVNGLHIFHRYDVSVPVISVALSENDQHLYIGQQDGKLLLIAWDDGADEDEDAE